MSGSISDELAHEWLQRIADQAYVSLHFDSPALGSTEITGGGYARSATPFSQPTNRSIWSLDDARFVGLDQNQITHFGIWDSKYSGMLLVYGRLPEKKVLLNGDGYIIREGQLAISLG